MRTKLQFPEKNEEIHAFLKAGLLVMKAGRSGDYLAFRGRDVPLTPRIEIGSLGRLLLLAQSGGGAASPVAILYPDGRVHLFDDPYEAQYCMPLGALKQAADLAGIESEYCNVYMARYSSTGGVAPASATL
jgi:hypothetical protein